MPTGTTLCPEVRMHTVVFLRRPRSNQLRIPALPNLEDCWLRSAHVADRSMYVLRIYVLSLEVGNDCGATITLCLRHAAKVPTSRHVNDARLMYSVLCSISPIHLRAILVLEAFSNRMHASEMP